MTAAAVLARLRALGVAAEARGDRLALRPASVIPPDLLAAAWTHKAELVALLAARAKKPPTGDLGEPLVPCAACGSGCYWRLSGPIPVSRANGGAPRVRRRKAAGRSTRRCCQWGPRADNVRPAPPRACYRAR
jgi:hypothetical protein